MMYIQLTYRVDIKITCSKYITKLRFQIFSWKHATVLADFLDLSLFPKKPTDVMTNNYQAESVTIGSYMLVSTVVYFTCLIEHLARLWIASKNPIRLSP